MASLRYLSGYPPQIQHQALALIEQGRLAAYLLDKYPEAHQVRSERALYDYVVEMKNRTMRKAPPVNKVLWDSKLHVIRNALGTHTFQSKVHGSKLRSSHEIRIGTVFRTAPDGFLRMIVVHELAHFKEKEHNKAFYNLCCHMEPDYHQLELDMRLYLTCLELGQKLY
nr:YgjP-like metallopeptidase domain-containing protein [Marinobacterium jannaschii]